MAQLNKSKLIGVRVTPERKRKAQRAAKAASKRRGERVTVSALVWELIEPGLDELLAGEEPEVAPAAQ
jgi:hypothetical protein